MDKTRCGWVKLSDPIYVAYHDEEWGKPLHDDHSLFELFSLVTQSAGLSWLTVLKKWGFKFIGSTTLYAFMEACGMVNNYENGCWCKSS